MTIYVLKDNWDNKNILNINLHGNDEILFSLEMIKFHAFPNHNFTSYSFKYLAVQNISLTVCD